VGSEMCIRDRYNAQIICVDMCIYIYISLLNYAYNMIIKIIKLYVCERERI
jgi:hypothetical protein